MPKLYTERECSRCPAVQKIEIDLKNFNPDAVHPKALVVMLDGERAIEHNYLCDNCKVIVMNFLKSIGKVVEKKSAVRVRAKKAEEPAKTAKKS